LGTDVSGALAGAVIGGVLELLQRLLQVSPAQRLA